MKHIHVPNERLHRWGLGLSPSNIVIPASAVTFSPVNGGALAWAGRTAPDYGGWSVTIPLGASKITDPYYGALIDLVSGDCSAMGRDYNLTPQQVASHFDIDSTDLQNLINYASSIGMACPTASNPNPVAPGVLTQQQVATVIASSPAPASVPVPSFVATDVALASSAPASSSDAAEAIPSSGPVPTWEEALESLTGSSSSSSSSGSGGVTATTATSTNDSLLWIGLGLAAVWLLWGK